METQIIGENLHILKKIQFIFFQNYDFNNI